MTNNRKSELHRPLLDAVFENVDYEKYIRILRESGMTDEEIAEHLKDEDLAELACETEQTMKAKYKHPNKHFIGYTQIYCMDNIFVVVSTYDGAVSKKVDVCLTNAEARREFFYRCQYFEENGYECIYKEVTQ